MEGVCFDKDGGEYWLADSEEPDAMYDRSVWERDLNLLKRSYLDMGVKEGIDMSFEPVVQRGFDKGYSLGASIGRRIGKFQSTLRNLLYLASIGIECNKKISEHEADFVRIFNEFGSKLTLKRIFSQSKMDYDISPIGSIKVDLRCLEEAECALVDLLLKCNWN